MESQQPQKTKKKKTFFQYLFSYTALAPLIIVSFCMLVENLPFVQKVEGLTSNARFQFRDFKNSRDPDPKMLDPRLFFIAMSDDCLERFGRWPWSRKVHAYFLEILSNAEPSSFVWDIIFDSPTQVDDLESKDLEEAKQANTQIIEFLNQHEGTTEVVKAIEHVQTLLNKAKKVDNPDELFLQAIKEMPDIPVITASAKGISRPKEFDIDWEVKDPNLLQTIPKRKALFTPIPELLKISQTGLVDVSPDSDGVIRKIPMLIIWENKIIPSLSLIAVMNYWKLTPENVTIIPGDGIYLKNDIIDKKIPINKQGEYYINYRYDVQHLSDAKSALEYSDLFDGLGAKYYKNEEFDVVDLKNKILLIGQTSTALTDIGPSPFNPESPRPLVHMNVMDNILTDDYLYIPDYYLLWGSILLIGYISLIALVRFNFWIRVIGPFSLLSLLIVGAFLLFTYNNVLIPLSAPTLALFFIHFGSVANQVLKERNAREHLRRTFSAYVSPQIINAIADNPQRLTLGGAHRDVTVLFSDIRSFTSIAESMDETELVAQLNEYFTEMVACINQYGGTLHKFIGDAIMAVWGDVAYSGPTIDAGQALRATIAMRNSLQQLNQKWVAEGKLEWKMGIGLNHGEVTVGNIGAPQRMEFTVIGDPVNLASRLEGLNKAFGTSIIVGEQVYRLTMERFIFRCLAKVRVKGKTQPVEIYEPMCEIGDEASAPFSMEWLNLYHEAYQRYMEKRFDVAARLFEACLADHPNDATCLKFQASCQEFMAAPPDEAWDGTFEFTTK